MILCIGSGSRPYAFVGDRAVIGAEQVTAEADGGLILQRVGCVGRVAGYGLGGDRQHPCCTFNGGAGFVGQFLRG